MYSHGCVVSLCDLTGNMLRPWAEAGFECYAVDIQHSIRKDRVEEYPGGGWIRYVWGDVRSWTPPGRVGMGFAFTPCTHLAVSGARDFRKKNWPMLRDGMDLFHAAVTAFQWAGCPWMAENPVGRIAGLHGPAEHTFHPYEYGGYLPEPGDAYTKLTCLWTGGGASTCRRRSQWSPRREAGCTGCRRRTIGRTFAARHPWASPARCTRPTTHSIANMTHNPDRYSLLGVGETVHGHHYRNTPHGPQLVEAHHIGTIIDADTEDEFLVELPPVLDHLQHVAGLDGFVEPGDVLAGDNLIQWAQGQDIGERFINGVTKHSGYRVYRRVPVPRQGDCDSTGWKKVRDGEALPHPTPAPREPGPVAMPADHKARKDLPLVTGVLRYFPDALLAVAACSKAGNDQHNPGKPLHWDRSKSGDELDALGRHLLAAGARDSDRIRHSTKVAWRALANLQKEIEQEGML